MEVLDAYVAGLIDGEGTITLSHNNKGDAYRTPVVSMTSTTQNSSTCCTANTAVR